ncbi:hypothetical protein ACFPN4_10100 [Ureibacillus thermophilus]|uniref:hypothetical protein n=1 Tax=Ureibacillus thermophilus TaxID=367743 RepID=UPI00361F168D
MEELKPFSDKILREIDKIRKEFNRDVVNKIGSNNAIIFYCKLYEVLFYEYLKTHGEFKVNDTKLLLTIGEIIKWVSQEKFIEDKEIRNLDVEVLTTYFYKALEVEQSNSAFLSRFGELFKAMILDTNKVEFFYQNEEIQFFEHVNHLLLTDYLQQKSFKFNELIRKGRKKGRYINAAFIAKSIVETEFELPDDYSVLGFTIGQLKEFWTHVIREAENVNHRNRVYFKELVKAGKATTLEEINGLKILEIDINKWKLRSLSKEQAMQLLDILSYNGQKKLNSIYSSLISEPIIKLPDNRYIVIPSSLAFYQAERYTLQVFDRFISYYQNKGEKVHTDDYKREDIFVNKLNRLFANFKYKNDTIKISNSNIDYLVYDENSKTLICFEIKWMIEPLTPTEIKNKDATLRKALEIQLPSYKKEIEENTLEILKKAFGHDFNDIPDNYYYFVLTNISIGSGLLDRSKFKIINFRMLQKAVRESSENLFNASQILQEDTYIRDANKFIESVITKNTCFGIEISQPEFKYKGGFSL